MKPRGRSGQGAAGTSRSSHRAVIALAVVGGAALLYGWSSMFLAPRGREVAAVKKQLAAARTQEQDLRQSLVQLRKVATDTQGREAELAGLNRLVPADPDLAGAIVTLDDTAKQAQVAWSSLVPSPPAPAVGGPTSIGLAIKVGGTFNQIYDYLRRLESLDRLVVVDSLSITAANGTGASPKLDVQMNARMFAAGTASAAAPAPAAPGASLTSGTSTAALPQAGG